MNARYRRWSVNFTFVLLVVFVPLVVGSLVNPSAAKACHGNGVSRACWAWPTRLEAVSYQPYYTYNYIYTQAWYYHTYDFFLYGDNACLSTWSCTHGIWHDGIAADHQVEGGHLFNHDGYSYSIANSYTDGICFNQESGGC